MPGRPGRVDQQGGEPLHPPIDGDVVDLDAPLAEKLFEVHDRLLEACLALVKVCECENGCPGCVGPQVEPASPAKRAAALLLERVLGV